MALRALTALEITAAALDHQIKVCDAEIAKQNEKKEVLTLQRRALDDSLGKLPAATDGAGAPSRRSETTAAKKPAP